MREFPKPQGPEEYSLFGNYCKYWRTYMWIQNTPSARKALRNHPGVCIYRSIHRLFWLGLCALVLLHAVCMN